MKIPDIIRVYGAMDYRGECQKEDAELITFFNWLHIAHPSHYAVAIHPDNEGVVRGDGFYRQSRQKAKGAIKKGAADIIICGSPTFVCELKRKDHTKSRWQEGQLEFLENCQKQGAFACVAFGFEGAQLAFNHWLLLGKGVLSE